MCRQRHSMVCPCRRPKKSASAPARRQLAARMQARWTASFLHEKCERVACGAAKVPKMCGVLKSDGPWGNILGKLDESRTPDAWVSVKYLHAARERARTQPDCTHAPDSCTLVASTRISRRRDPSSKRSITNFDLHLTSPKGSGRSEIQRVCEGCRRSLTMNGLVRTSWSWFVRLGSHDVAVV